MNTLVVEVRRSWRATGDRDDGRRDGNAVGEDHESIPSPLANRSVPNTNSSTAMTASLWVPSQPFRSSSACSAESPPRAERSDSPRGR